MIELRRRYSGSKWSDSPSFSRLPADYQEVEYLESTGGQWIKTNIPASDGTDIKIDFQLTTYVQGSCLFGAYITNPATRWYMYWRQEYEYNFGHGQDKNVLITNPYDRHLVEYITSNKEVKIDGSVVKNFSTTVNTNLNIWIFNCNDNYAGTYPIYAKVFSFYAETSTDKYDLIPCYRTSDYKPGMYDIVNDVFYTNAGEGEFSYGQDVHYNIPPEYQQVEYLGSTGEQYIVTNIVLNGWDKISTKLTNVQFNETPRCAFGVRESAVGDIGIRMAIYLGQPIVDWYYSSGTSSELREVSSNSFNIEINKGDILINDESIINSVLNLNFTIPLYLFGLNYNGSPTQYFKGRIHTFFVENKAHLIPCYRKEDEVAGMYDVVNGVFYTNAGTGTFEVGPEVIG